MRPLRVDLVSEHVGRCDAKASKTPSSPSLTYPTPSWWWWAALDTNQNVQVAPFLAAVDVQLDRSSRPLADPPRVVGS
jgi:hypothetical protein